MGEPAERRDNDDQVTDLVTSENSPSGNMDMEDAESSMSISQEEGPTPKQEGHALSAIGNRSLVRYGRSSV